MRFVWPSPRRTSRIRLLTTLLRAVATTLLLLSLGMASILAEVMGSDIPKQVLDNVKAADRLIDAADRSLQANHFEDLQTCLRDYKKLLQASSVSVKEFLSGRRKIPRHFKSAEILLRKQLKRLQDLRPGLPIPLRPDLDAAADQADQLRRQLFGELFDVNAPPPNKSKQPLKK